MLAKVRLPRAQLQPQFHALRSFNGALIETHNFWVRIFVFVAVERRRQLADGARSPLACHELPNSRRLEVFDYDRHRSNGGR